MPAGRRARARWRSTARAGARRRRAAPARRRPSTRRCRSRTPAAAPARSSSAIAATSAGSTGGTDVSPSARSGTSPELGPNTSSGKSTKVGPRCAVIARRAAWWTTEPAEVGSVTVAADFVIDATTGTWSISCSEPEPHRACAARPPSTTTGEPLNHALVIAETPLVIPGPAVRAANPGPAGELRVRLRGEGGGLLVARVDDPHVPAARRLVQRPDVPTVQGEHHVGPEAADGSDRLLPGVSLDHRHLHRLARRGSPIVGRWRAIGSSVVCASWR